MELTDLTPLGIILLIGGIYISHKIGKGFNQLMEEAECNHEIEEVKKQNPNIMPFLELLYLSDVWLELPDEKRTPIIEKICMDVDLTNKLYADAKAGRDIIMYGCNYGKVV